MFDGGLSFSVLRVAYVAVKIKEKVYRKVVRQTRMYRQTNGHSTHRDMKKKCRPRSNKCECYDGCAGSQRWHDFN